MKVSAFFMVDSLKYLAWSDLSDNPKTQPVTLFINLAEKAPWVELDPSKIHDSLRKLAVEALMDD